MDNFREWLSDNLRYFLLGFAILAVVIIAAIGIRIYQRVEGSAQKPTDNVRVESETSSAAGETAKGTEKTSETEKQSETKASEKATEAETRASEARETESVTESGTKAAETEKETQLRRHRLLRQLLPRPQPQRQRRIRSI